MHLPYNKKICLLESAEGAGHKIALKIHQSYCYKLDIVLFLVIPGSPEKKPFKPIQKVYETRVLKKPNGDEEVLDETEIIYSMEIRGDEDGEESCETIEDGEDNNGIVVQRVVHQPVFLTKELTSIKHSELLPNGKKRDIEEKMVEESPVTVAELTKTKHFLYRSKEQSDKESVVEQLEDFIPLEITKRFESEPEIDFAGEDQSISVMRTKCWKIVQKKGIRRVFKSINNQNGKSIEPVEDIIEELIEPNKLTNVCKDSTTDIVKEPDYEMPKSTVEEEKDSQGNVVRRVLRKAVLVIPKRMIYRKIVLACDGTEEYVEEKVEEPTIFNELPRKNKPLKKLL